MYTLLTRYPPGAFSSLFRPSAGQHVSAITNASAFNTGQSSAILGDPRTYGLTLRWTI